MRSFLAIAAVSALGVMAQDAKAPAAAVPPPKAPAAPAAPAPPAPLAWAGISNPGPGVVPAAGVTLPDLSGDAARFPPGTEVNSTKLAIQGKVGAYSVGIIEDAAFPNRTVYVPQNVPNGTRVPIFAWQNGSCRLYGRMYQAFLHEIASHGFLVIANGPRDALDPGRSTADRQIDSVKYARKWANAPFTVDKDKIAFGGHSCGGGETSRNLAQLNRGQVTTGLIFNSVGQNEDLRRTNVPLLLVHGGKTDTEARATEAFNYVQRANSDLPIALVGLQTGHLGSFWWPRGGIYAETAVKWLNGYLKNNRTDKAFFEGGRRSPAATRGWAISSNNLNE